MSLTNRPSGHDWRKRTLSNLFHPTIATFLSAYATFNVPKSFLSITFEKLRITYDHTLELETRFQLNSFHYSQHLIQTTYYVSNVRCRFFALLEHFDSPLALSRLLWLYLSRDCCCNCDRDFWKFEFHPSFTNSSRETLKILEFTKGNSERNGSTRWKFFFLSSARS